MHNYTVDIATYDGSGSDKNPRIWIHGTVDGISSGYFAVFWAGIHQSFAINGTAGVQAYLAPILYHGVFGPPYLGNPTNDISGPQVPNFSSSSIPAPVTAGASSISVPVALVPPWTQ